MKSVTSWLLNIGAIAFWAFRVVVLVCDSLNIDFPLKPMDAMVEIPILFITVVCLVFVFKRNIFGALVYAAIYVGYFGTDIFQTVGATDTLTSNDILSVVVSVLGIFIALANVIEVAVAGKGRSTTKAVKDTDWFYQNEQFDRQLDERADKNQYKIN